MDHSQLVGAYVDPARSRMIVGEWAKPWLAGRANLKPKTIASYESLLRTRVLPTWNNVRLAEVTYVGVVGWVAAMRTEGLSASRVRQSYHLLTSMLDDAVRDNRLPRNPAAGVGLPKLPTKEQRFLTHGQLAALASATRSYRLLVLVLGYCGLRWGEVAALRLRRVDLMRRRLAVHEAVIEVNGKIAFDTPKNHQHRSVPIPRFLAEELALRLAGKTGDDLVFTSPQGCVLREQNFRRGYFDRATVEAGVPGLTPHELRHTAASLAVSAGANVKAVQRMLGHKSAAMTLDVYSGLFDDDLDGVAEQLDAAARISLVPLVRPRASVTPIGREASRL